jgi:hypothetical protein
VADDPDGQSLLFSYPAVTTARDDYIRPAVKIESGAKSALDPHEEMSIVPYISDDVPRLGLIAQGVTTVGAERTFWDKVVILHGVRKWFENRGVLRGQGPTRLAPAPGTFSVRPNNEMLKDLRGDYRRMAGMIIGESPEFEDVVASIAHLEERLNRSR